MASPAHETAVENFESLKSVTGEDPEVLLTMRSRAKKSETGQPKISLRKGKQGQGKVGKAQMLQAAAEPSETDAPKQAEISGIEDAGSSASALDVIPASGAGECCKVGVMKKPLSPDMMKMLPPNMQGLPNLKNFSFDALIEHVCMEAWHSEDDGGRLEHHIPQGSKSRRLLMALVRGDSEGEAAAEDIANISAKFKRPLNTDLGRNTKGRGSKSTKLDPVANTLDRASRTKLKGTMNSDCSIDVSGAQADDKNVTPEARRRTLRSSKRSRVDMDAAAKATDKNESDSSQKEGDASKSDIANEEEDLPKKKRILVSLIKGDKKTRDELAVEQKIHGQDAEAGSCQTAPSTEAETEKVHARLKKNAKNSVASEIESVGEVVKEETDKETRQVDGLIQPAEGIGSRQIDRQIDPTEICVQGDRKRIDDGNRQQQDAERKPETEAKQAGTNTGGKKNSDQSASNPVMSSCTVSQPQSSSSGTHSLGEEEECTCPVCGDHFVSKYYLKYHMKIHTGEKPFQCQKCNKTFTHKASLRAHTDVHNREGQTYHCSICDRKFEYAYLLERHRKMHVRHQCEECGKSMNNRQSLVSHKRSEHRRKFSYECDVCGKKYARFSAFVSHQKTHVVDGSKDIADLSSIENCDYDDELDVAVGISSFSKELSPIVMSSPQMNLAPEKPGAEGEEEGLGTDYGEGFNLASEILEQMKVEVSTDAAP